MSLLDALLLESSLINVWIAHRTRTPPGTAGLALGPADGGILDYNILDVKTEYPKRCLEAASRNISYFHNRDSAGNLIRGYNLNTKSFKSQLEDAVQSALLLSM